MAADPQMAMMRDDPPLSESGRARASLLAEMLRDAGITHIFTTDAARTRETIRPIAEILDIQPAVYDASNLEAFAEVLRSTPGRHLVAGHSDTTPGLSAALGGEPGPPIELLEYDRLYLVVIDGGSARTILLRFGEPYIGSG
jgi:broad specificity phosphatase PhoE